MPISLCLSGKVALVTGGSRGVGAAVVRMFSCAGAKVAFSFRAAKAQAEALTAELGAENCAPIPCDLTGTKNAKSLVDSTVARFDKLDILVANHGVWEPADVPIENMSADQWRNTLSVNLDSVFALIKSSVAQMKKQTGSSGAKGHIVLVSSTAGQRGEAFHCDYAASKGALISMVKGLATELIRSGIYVNCVAPGWVDTDMSRPALEHPESHKSIYNSIPLGRVAKPEEIAAPILFLCTEHAGFICGEIFNVNGGAVLVG
jgi:3-oxoacyl-[acyl-carrier protein] reductase